VTLRSVAVTALLGSGWFACGVTTSPVCTADVRAGLVLTVRDATSLLPVESGIVVTVQDGDWTEAASSGPNGVYTFAQERKGRYDIRIEGPAYRTWVRLGVDVTADECHVATVSLTVDLLPGT